MIFSSRKIITKKSTKPKMEKKEEKRRKNEKSKSEKWKNIKMVKHKKVCFRGFKELKMRDKMMRGLIHVKGGLNPLSEWIIPGYFLSVRVRKKREGIIYFHFLSMKVKNKRVRSCNGNIGKAVKLIHWNLGSMYWDKKVINIQELVDDMNPDAIFISEANLFDGLEPHLRSIERYKLIVTKDFTARGCSRLVLLVREDFQVTLKEELMEEKIASIWFKISRRGCKSITVGGFYREHRLLLNGIDNNTEEFQVDRLKSFVRQWTIASREGHCLVLGDLNLDILRWRNPPQAHQEMVNCIKTNIETLNFSQIIVGYTRSWPGAVDSLIDHCWTNQVDKILSMRNIVKAVGDHNVLEIIVRTKGKILTEQDVLKRNWKKMNLKRFLENAAKIKWELVQKMENLDLANSWMEEQITNLLDKEAPWITVQQRKGYKAWVSDDTKTTMTNRDNYRECARLTGSKENWEKYKIERNSCNKKLRNDRNEFFRKKYSNLEDSKDVSGTYRLLKKQAGWRNEGPPKQFLMDGKVENSPVKMANALADYFQKKIIEIQATMRLNNTDPLDILQRALDRWSKTNQREELVLKEVSELKVLQAIKELGNSTSSGIEGLDSITLKVLAPLIYKPLTHICNLSIRKSLFISKWKIAKIVPIYKGKNKPRNQLGSYRPVSLLPVVAKIVERLIQKQLMQHMIKSKQMNTNQHAYRANHSTTSAICQLADNIYQATDSNMIATLLAVDQSAAFDTVDHSILLRKLRLYNCSLETVAWFRSYLSFRSQFVLIGGKRSNMKTVSSGVPQGSIVGPLLYSIYTNEMSDTIREKNNCQHVTQDQEHLFSTNCSICGSIVNYADDTTLIMIGNSRESNQNKLRENLNHLNEFLENNKLAINRTKTTIAEIMVGQKRVKLKDQPPTLTERETDGTMKIIKCQTEVRLLGASISDNLLWDAHIETGQDALLPAVRKSLGILRHIGKNIPQKSKKLLTEGLVVSKIRYLIALWGGTSIKNISKAQVLLNDAARFITGKNRRTNTTELMQDCNWLTVSEMTKHSTLLLLWKSLRTSSPQALKDKIEIDENNFVSTQRPRLMHTTFGWRWRATELWNCLPGEIRQIESITNFKKQTKLWLISRRETDEMEMEMDPDQVEIEPDPDPGPWRQA